MFYFIVKVVKIYVCIAGKDTAWRCGEFENRMPEAAAD
jgi:hypothetical protein